MSDEETTECECDICTGEEEPKCEVCDEPEDLCECSLCDYCGEKVYIYDVIGCEHCGEYFCMNHENACGCQCSECGELPDYCECGQGFGDSDTPPWERRGVVVQTGHKTAHWTELFPTLAQFDPVQTAADFYLLESIANDVPFSESRPAGVQTWVHDPDLDREIAAILELTDDQLDFWVKKRDKVMKPSKTAEAIAEAKMLFHSLVHHADEHLVPYFHMAIGGELRHHRAIGHSILSSSRDYAWHGWMTIFEKVGNRVYLDAAELFREFGGGSYGGENWAVPSEIFHSRLEGNYSPSGDPDDFTNKQIFVDRAWTLQHNGGCFLNKVMWRKADDNKIGNINHMQTLLNAHASDPTDYQTLIGAASTKVGKLFKAYWSNSVKELKEAGFDLPETHDSMGTIPRPVCRECGSNPKFGHTMSCNWVIRQFAEGDPTRIIQPEDFPTASFNNWVSKDLNSAFAAAGIKKYFFDPEGNITYAYTMNPTTRFTLRFQIETEYGSLTWKHEGDVDDFITGNCIYSVESILDRADANEMARDAAMERFKANPSNLTIRYRINGDDSFGEFHPIPKDFNNPYQATDWAQVGFGAFIAQAMKTRMGVS